MSTFIKDTKINEFDNIKLDIQLCEHAKWNSCGSLKDKNFSYVKYVYDIKELKETFLCICGEHCINDYKIENYFDENNIYDGACLEIHGGNCDIYIDVSFINDLISDSDDHILEILFNDALAKYYFGSGKYLVMLPNFEVRFGEIYNYYDETKKCVLYKNKTIENKTFKTSKEAINDFHTIIIREDSSVDSYVVKKQYLAEVKDYYIDEDKQYIYFNGYFYHLCDKIYYNEEIREDALYDVLEYKKNKF